MEIKDRYGRLVPTGRFLRKLHSGKIRLFLEVQCDCGVVIWRMKDTLGSGTPSCGCAFKQVCGLSSRFKKGYGKTHGLTNSSEYSSWKKMIARCEIKSQHGYERYGGRGITIHPEWRSNFQSFYDYIGPKPSHSHSVGRIDYDLGYVPGNVRWETPKEQGVSKCTNRIISHQGIEMPLIYWIDKYRLPNRFMTEKTLEGWTIQECIDLLLTDEYQNKIRSAVSRKKYRSQYWAGTRFRSGGKPIYFPFQEYT